jgi:phosphoribosylformylglycinamidine cyclo-ligase
MVVDDLAASGARPLGLVDYLAVGGLDRERDHRIVTSIAQACTQAGVALLGGETAEHPGVMAPDQIDLAAAALGVVEDGHELGSHRVKEGDLIIGLPSPNLRSNGFSLVRQIVADRDLGGPVDGEDASLGEVLLRASVLYSPVVQAVLGSCHAAVHVTGGGLIGNLPRVLPAGLGARLETSRWEVPEIFRLLQQWGSIPSAEMFSVFNMGIGFCLLLPPEKTDPVLQSVEGSTIGEVVSGSGVILRSS